MRPTRKKTPLRERLTYSGSHAVRHPDCDCRGDIDIHLTLCADHDDPFRDESIAATVCENVEFYCKRLGFRLYGFCLMPDHLHVLLSPGDSGVAVAKWLDSFKSYTTSRFMKTGGRPPLWRPAHDHVCRDGETAEQVLTYINYPERKTLDAVIPSAARNLPVDPARCFASLSMTCSTISALISNNPVRARLVERWDRWPWTTVFIAI